MNLYRTYIISYFCSTFFHRPKHKWLACTYLLVQLYTKFAIRQLHNSSSNSEFWLDFFFGTFPQKCLNKKKHITKISKRALFFPKKPIAYNRSFVYFIPCSQPFQILSYVTVHVISQKIAIVNTSVFIPKHYTLMLWYSFL